MKYIDLTHTFGKVMPVYPGDPIPEISQVAEIVKDGYNDFKIETGMHVGTHIDAPLHMIENGISIPSLPIEKFFGRGRLIDAVGKRIDASLLDEEIRKGDIVIINSGHYKKFKDADYYTSYPIVEEDFARRAVELGVSIVAMDTPSPDHAPFATHKILLGGGVLIIENLTNLDSLESIGEFDICALPAKLDTEAAPVRVIAIVK